MKVFKSILLGILLSIITGCGNNSPDISTYIPQPQVTASWEITQYGPRDINSSFYTIYSEEHGLIVIDGGWTEDAAYVREVINYKRNAKK